MQGEEPRETWYQPEGFFYFLATSRESCRSGVERWDVWGWREWIRHKVYRPWTMAHEVSLTPPQRLDAERRLRQFLPCWECCTKTFPPPFLICSVWDVRREPGGLLFEEVLLQWGVVCLSSFLSLCSISDRHASATSRRDFPSHRWKQGTRSPQQIKSLSRKSDWDFVWPLNSQHAVLLMGGELESGGSIDPPVTFTRLA